MTEKVLNRAYLKYEDLTQDKQQVNAIFRVIINMNEKTICRASLR